MSDDLAHWTLTAADGYAFPGAVPLPRLVEQLLTMLSAPDPVVRDDRAYTAAARWIRDGHLDAVLVDLGDGASAHFTHPEVQARTFAPLMLQCVLTRGLAAPGSVPKAAAERWYGAFAQWYPAETDCRGWDDTLGWLHAVAHGADAAAAFARTLPERRTAILELCARRMTAAQAEHRYVQCEDARLARAVTRILAVPGLSVAEATGWLDTVEKAFTDGGPGAVPVWAFNTFATLQSLHLHLTRGLADGGIPPHADAVTARALEILRLPYGWLA